MVGGSNRDMYAARPPSKGSEPQSTEGQAEWYWTREPLESAAPTTPQALRTRMEHQGTVAW